MTLGDKDAEAAQQGHQPRHGHLPLMVLGEHETAQFRSEMPVDAGRKWGGDHVAIRRLPALTPEIHDMRTNHQILHHEARVALKARADRRRSLDNLFLVDCELRLRAAALAVSLSSRLVRLRLGRLFHATRFEVRSSRAAFEAGDLIAQRRNGSLLLG